jgi:1-aminocyclopropane-1-carboxylate deaminase
MEFIFVSREMYQNKNLIQIFKQNKLSCNDYYIIPEGGTNFLGVKGCEEILTQEDKKYFSHICCAVGTGGTISGIINSSNMSQKILGFSSLKGDFLKKDINIFANQNNWELITDYHFGGYGKTNDKLINFINGFKKEYGIQLDPIYTGKMMFGIFDLIQKNYFKENSKILTIHTGGLQGIKGMNKILQKKNKTLIDV